MSLALTIHPLDNDLNMYGELDAGSAYSLSGHVSLSVTSPYSFFEARKTARLLLQSVSLTFEGQSEIFTPSTGYSSLRLCSITRELAPSTPIELSNEGHEEDADPCVWNIIFNLPIPGWLPATTALGIEEIGVRYALYATAKFTNLDEEQTPATWSIASLCAPFRSRIKSSYAQTSVNICRFISAPKSEATELSLLNYLVNSTPTAPSNPEADVDRIPAGVLSKIQVLASVPEYLDVNSNALPLTLRLRTKDLVEEECKKLQVTEVEVDIVQQEKCRYRPTRAYLSRFPVPAKDLQPPNVPLLEPHPVSFIYDAGLFSSSPSSECATRTFSLLPAEESGKYKLDDQNYVFAGDATPGALPTWYTMDTTLPFVQRSTSRWAKYDSDEAEHEALEWAGPKELRPTSSGPLYSVTHEVSISLTCTYDLKGKGGPVVRERLSFKVPLTFGKVAPRLVWAPVLVDSSENAPILTPAPGSSGAPNLPAYTELYDADGERRVDYSTPLPLYTPRSSTSLSTTSAEGQPIDVSVPSANEATTTNVNAYHGVNIDGDAEKRHTAVLLQDVDVEGSDLAL
ncbi:hypothetical protein M413DRAFT_85695 [Hebeloma cylindrosporum]|uniref:Uncharacterized protein n=1 Tax=Hebeloma cylindrosporum TaxID=76867 RepID=A0A0C2YGB7_HEBCY|nr:hypothetical protein M413DRAFT_85695 [Hebeloma cylindrosporum h7]